MSNKKKILFVINPKSGIGRQKLVKRMIPGYLDLSAFDYEIAFTQYSHHAVLLAKEAAKNNFDIVVAVGGDGSANDVAQGLVNTNTAMAIIPVGSGNGLAHHLKIPSRISRAIKIINKFKISRIDTATMNDKLFISIAGLGFDALVAEKFAQHKLRGFFTYFKLTIGEFFKYKPLEYSFYIQGEKITRKALLISFANSNQFGYNASISPKASVSDGFINLCIVNKMTVIQAASIAYKLFLNNIDSSKYIEDFKVKEITVSCETLSSSHIDGDPDIHISRAHIKINPESLNIVVP